MPQKRTSGKRSKAHAVVHPIAVIERRIHLLRGQKIMLDRDLAELYGVTTGNLNLAVRRNANRFPEDFMFKLKSTEVKSLLLQIAIAKGRGGRRTLPYAFTEQGVAMLSSVLKTERAAQVNVLIMRAFVRMREMLVSHKDLLRKLEKLEEKYDAHEEDIKAIFDTLRKLIQPPPGPTRRIGFVAAARPVLSS